MKGLDQSQLFAVLADLLMEADIDIRANVIEVALRLNKAKGVKLVLPILNNSKDDLRIHACGLMHEFGTEEAIEPVLRVLKQDPDPQGRGVAAYALGGIGHVRAIPALAWVEQHDHEYDWSGHSPSSSAIAAITSILKSRIIDHVTKKTGQIIRQSFADGSELNGQIMYLSNDPPYQNIKKSNNPYRDLPDNVFEPTETRTIESTSLHPFPFAVEIMFRHPTCKVERAFIFSRPDPRWTIETVLRRHAG